MFTKQSKWSSISFFGIFFICFALVDIVVLSIIFIFDESFLTQNNLLATSIRKIMFTPGMQIYGLFGSPISQSFLLMSLATVLVSALFWTLVAQVIYILYKRISVKQL